MKQNSELSSPASVLIWMHLGEERKRGLRGGSACPYVPRQHPWVPPGPPMAPGG